MWNERRRKDDLVTEHSVGLFEEISSVICKKCKVESEVCSVTVPVAKGEGQLNPFVPLTKHFPFRFGHGDGET